MTACDDGDAPRVLPFRGGPGAARLSLAEIEGTSAPEAARLPGAEALAVLARWADLLREADPGGYACAEPLEATQAAPGSAEKCRVLRRRLAAGQSLHHPRDRTLAGPPATRVPPSAHGEPKRRRAA